MKRESIKGWLFLGIGSLILFYLGYTYQVGGWSINYTMVLAAVTIAAPPLYLTGYRLVGSVPAWIAMAAGLLFCWLGGCDIGTALLGWALCCGTPLAVSLFWPNFPRIKPLCMAALPVAGGIWLAGALGYARLHLGSWDLSAITNRIGVYYLKMVDLVETIHRQTLPSMEAQLRPIYGDQLPQVMEQAEQSIKLLREVSHEVSFQIIVMIAYGLFGLFFFGVWVADRAASPSAKERWLGSWATLIPGRGISFLYMLLNIFSLFIGGTFGITLAAAFDLFGYFYVFTALYTLHRFLRKKNWPRLLRGGLIGLLFLLSYTLSGNIVLSPYMLLLFAGWWIATAPKSLIRS